MIENRLVAFIKPVVLWSMLLLALLAVAAGFAHARVTEGVPPTVAVEPGTLAGTAVVWLMGALVALKVIEMALTWIAPRTKTHLDDDALSVVHSVRETAQEILTHVKAPSPTVVVNNAQPPEPRDPQAGKVAPGMLWLIGLGGAVVAATMLGLPIIAGSSGCATAERAGNAAKVAALDCGKPQLATAAALVARWAVEDAEAGAIQWPKHETDATGFLLGVGTCAYAELRAAYKSKPTVQALAAGPPPDDGSAGLERLRAKLGGGEIRLADGSVQ